MSGLLSLKFASAGFAVFQRPSNNLSVCWSEAWRWISCWGAMKLWPARTVSTHILVAFLGYCLRVCLKQKLKMVAGSITPARALESLRSIFMVEVWFRLRDGHHLCLSPITEPEKEQPSRSSRRNFNSYEASDYMRVSVTLLSGVRAWVYVDPRYAAPS